MDRLAGTRVGLAEVAAWLDAWGPLADVARALGLPALGPLTMPPVRIS